MRIYVKENKTARTGKKDWCISTLKVCGTVQGQASHVSNDLEFMTESQTKACSPVINPLLILE